jgi:hypothetical protein
MGWATFWAIFSQTHLVTLPVASFSSQAAEVAFSQRTRVARVFLTQYTKTGPSKFTLIGIFGLKKYHLATLQQTRVDIC